MKFFIDYCNPNIQSRSRAMRAALITIRCYTVNKLKWYGCAVPPVRYSVEHVASFKHCI